MQAKAHWEKVYKTKAASEVSWFQPHAERSLELIRKAGVPPTSRIIDVGGGASTLVDDLLDTGFRDITVLDISANALAVARARLGRALRMCAGWRRTCSRSICWRKPTISGMIAQYFTF